MKKNDLILLSTVGLYSYLFYKQAAGINFLVFTLCLLLGLLIKDNQLYKNKAWIVTAIASLLSGIAVILYGNFLSVFTNILSLSLAASFSLSKDSSLVFSLLYSAYSYISSIFYIAYDFMERKRAAETETAYAKLLITFVPLVIALLFLFIYRESNPLFRNFTEQFSLTFITWGWIGFTLLGFILLYGFYYPRQILLFLAIDQTTTDDLNKEKTLLINTSGKMLNIHQENTLGIVLFALLNVLLFTVNGLDINYLLGAQKLPDGLSHSEVVHQGVNMLIVSIIIAILIILYYFRGSLNFYEKNNTVKILAYLWIFQNAIMIFSSGIKNDMYINEFGLTYKRIGVYVYLLLSLIGLVTTFIKILKIKNNWFLFRKNAWAFYSVLVLSCIFNWDLIIAQYNIHYFEKTLDKEYLLSLSDSVIPALLKIEAKENKMNVESDYQYYLINRKNEFIERYENSAWQSWNLEDDRIYEEVKSK